MEAGPNRFIAIYAHFFTGPFFRETGPSQDLDYGTAWITHKFLGR